MAEPVNPVKRCAARQPSLLCPLTLCWLLLGVLVWPPAPTLAFELASLMVAFYGSSRTAECPASCTCTTRRAEDMLQDDVSAYLPSMGLHMNPDLESKLRASVSLLTAWLGNMNDVRCQVGEGERLRLSELLHTSTLSFTSIHFTCQPGGGVVWDVVPQTTVLNMLQLSHCQVIKAEGSQALPVPHTLWLLDLDGVPGDAVHSLDLSAAGQLRFLSVTGSNLSSVPLHWSASPLPQLAFLCLARNMLHSYDCEVSVTKLTALNLDHNRLTALPPCVVGGSRTTTHLSLRHNRLHGLEGLLVDTSEDDLLVTPDVSYLDLAHNRVRSLLALRKVEKLLGLDVSHNRISVLAQDAFSLNPKLRWLDLSFNQLQALSDGTLSQLVAMRHLNLSHNHLWVVGTDNSPLTDTPVTVDLRHNHLLYPPFADTGFVPPRLTRVMAANNPYRCDCAVHLFLQTVRDLDRPGDKHWFSLSWRSSSRGTDQAYLDNEDMTCNQPADIQGTPLVSLSYHKACPLLRGCPKGCVCHLIKDGDRHVTVNCSLCENLTELPTAVPMLLDIPLVLYFNHSGLKRLDHRPYLRHVRELHAGYSRVSSITSSAFLALQNVSVLSLHHNQLRSMPAVLQNLTMPVLTNLSLGGNPWTCGCPDLWMPAWMASHAPAVFDLNNVRCRWTGKAVSRLHPGDLSCGVLHSLPLVIALSMAVGLAVVVLSLLARYKLELLVAIYSHFRLRPFDMFRYDTARPHLFDVFVSSSQHDYGWVVEKLVDQLQNRARPYRLCLPLRDFPVGATLGDSTRWAVDNSRCTLLVLTRQLLGGEWSMAEFRAAHEGLLKRRGSGLVVLVHGPLDARSLDRPLLQYLRTHIYLRTEDKTFWSKLEYVLPAPQGPLVSATWDVSTAMGGPEDLSSCMETDCGQRQPAMAAGDVSPKHHGGNSSSASA